MFSSGIPDEDFLRDRGMTDGEIRRNEAIYPLHDLRLFVESRMKCGKTLKEAISELEDLREIEDIKNMLSGSYRENQEFVPFVTCDNFKKIIENDSYFNTIEYNSLRGMVERSGKNWTDTDDSSARCYIEKAYGIFSIQKFRDAFRTVIAGSRGYNPIQRMLTQVEWDGTPRICNILQKWLLAPDNGYTSECARLIFAGGIHRAFEPGCKFDDVIVFQGKQGCGKSTFTQWLAVEPKFFNSIKTITGQKAYEAIAGKFVVEIEELLATMANDRGLTVQEETCKSFLSTQVDTYRRPYDTRPDDYPRSCIFIGTTNRNTFLTDKTGNRRWYPLMLNADSNNAAHLYANADECKSDIMQCWAEMKHHYDSRSQYAAPYLPPEKWNMAQQIRSEAEEDDFRVGLIDGYLEKIKNAGYTKVCIIEIWKRALHSGSVNTINGPSRAESNAILEILTHTLGWVRCPKKARHTAPAIDGFPPEAFGPQVVFSAPET